MEMGDVPYSDALQGEVGNITPKYDSQKDVMLQVLDDLEEAYTLFGQAKNFDGDPVLGGDVSKWQKRWFIRAESPDEPITSSG